MPTFEHEITFDKVRKDIRNHIKRHKAAYSFGVGIGIAGITCLIMRDVISLPISRGSAVTAKRGIAVLGKKVVMNNVSYISATRQGPPSWVVRCKETGDIFTSQNSAALYMRVDAAMLSKHLNGVREHVDGLTFERICLAA